MRDQDDSGPRARPTLKTIAQLSGLAVPTVSRALNDAPDINVDTKKRIRKIAHEIGYIPDPSAVRLRTGRTNVISLLISTEMDIQDYSGRLVASIATALRNTPYQLIVTPYFPDEDPMKPVRYIVESGSADAIIMNRTQPADPRIALLMKRNFPFATHGSSDWSDEHPYYDFDNNAFGQIGVSSVTKRGRRHIAVLAPPLDQTYARHLVQGATKAKQKNGQKLTLIEDATSDDSNALIVQAVRELLQNDPSVDAIICASATSALGVAQAIEAQGLTVGKEIDVFSKEAMPFLKLFREDIITVTEDICLAGDFLAKAAMQAILQPALPPMQYLEVPTED